MVIEFRVRDYECSDGTYQLRLEFLRTYRSKPLMYADEPLGHDLQACSTLSIIQGIKKGGGGSM